MTIEALRQALEEKFGNTLGNRTEFRGELTYTIALSDLRAVLTYCKEDLRFDFLLDISSVDNLDAEPRFEVVYELYSLTKNVHLRIKATASEDSNEVPTVCDLWPTANWHEREIYDMMGILFQNHPDLRRILMWEGYPYFPLRKDFPLEGKESNVPEVAFTSVAPLAGGPFVTSPTSETSPDREPRSRA